MKKRVDWLDIGKGLGILFVMLGHTNIPTPIKTYIYTFHMPLFFFLSGYLFDLNKISNIKDFLSRKIKKLLLPYLFFSLIAYIWFVILFKFGQVSYSHNILKPLIGTFVATRKSVWTVHTGPLWFLSCLLCTEILFYLISKIGNTKKRTSIILLFISVVGCFYNKTIGKPLPWNIDVAMISVGFYGLGYFYRIYKMKVEQFFNIKSFFVFLIVNIVVGHLNFVHSGERVDLYNSSLGNIYLFYISAFSGIAAFIILIRRVKTNKILQFLGQNSLIYLAFHQKIAYFIFDYIVQNTFLNSEKLLQISMVKGCIYTLMAFFFIAPTVFFINRYIPFILGKKKVRKNNNRNLEKKLTPSLEAWHN